MDLERVIAKLHEELGLIDRAIADLERLPVNGPRGPGRPRSVRRAGHGSGITHKKRGGGKADVESKNSD